MEQLETLKLLKGKQTSGSTAEILSIKESSALNLISKLKKEGYVKTSGGGRQKRIYTISLKKEVSSKKNLFDIINKYSKIKVVPIFKHVVYGKYGLEEALIDAVLTGNFRIILAGLYLFNKIRNWKKLHHLARKNNIEPEIGALYDLARMNVKSRKMPRNIYKSLKKRRKKVSLIKGLRTDDEKVKKINKYWRIELPFSKKDLEEL